MLRPLLLAFGIPASFLSYGQAARLVFNSAGTAVNQHPFVVFNPAANSGTYLVLDNSNANAITMVGAVTANVPIIKSEREENKVRWATGAATGTYMVPFATGTTVAGTAIPLTVNKTSPGAGSGSLIFSTYNSLSIGTGVPSGWDNNNYRPSDVTHMNDMPSGTVNNSANAIDRFWIIDPGQAPYAYTTPPGVTITFGFEPSESVINGGNSAGLNSTNGNLVAQRFNSSLNKWYDILPLGTQTGNTVGGVTPPTTGDFFRSWTLSNSLLPLPIQLVEWNGTCEGKVVKLTWTTASEQDNAFFTIERSRDAADWSAIGTVPGAGNSSGMLSYSFMDADPQGMAYYRLRQTDINGNTTVSAAITAGCTRDNGTTIVNAWDDGDFLYLVVSSTVDAVYDLVLTDAQGKLLLTRASQAIHTGHTTLHVDKRNIATGIYLVQLVNDTDRQSRRVHLE